jgi:hypothetical protein
LQAHGLFEDKINGRESGLPCLDRNPHEAISKRKRLVWTILVGDRVYFFTDEIVPVLVVGQVDQHPGGVDARVELASE